MAGARLRAGGRRTTLAAVGPWAALAASALLPVWVQDSYVLHVFTLTGIYLVLALSFNLVFGYAGLLSLAHSAFFGVGAYAAALASLHWGVSFPVALALSAAVGGGAGLLVGVPALRLNRHAFVMITLSFTLLVQILALNWVDLTRGAMGLPGIPPAELRLGGWSWRAASRTETYYLTWVAAAASVALMTRVGSSRFGRALRAVQQDEVLAESQGIPTFRVKLGALALSAAVAGCAGALFAVYLGFTDPSVFDFYYMETVLLMTVLGGPGTVWGVVGGSLLVGAIPEILRMARALRMVLYGLFLVLAILFMPDGLAGYLRRAGGVRLAVSRGQRRGARP